MTAPTSAEALLACLNASNDPEVAVEADEITFGIPQPPTRVGFNSSIQVTATPDSQYSGGGEYHYNRVDMDVLALTDPIYIEEPEGAQVSELVAYLNQTFRLGLQESDIANWNDPLPDLNGEATDVTIVAHPNSLAWVGQITAQVITDSAPLELSDVITGLDLDGFSTTAPVPGE